MIVISTQQHTMIYFNMLALISINLSSSINCPNNTENDIQIAVEDWEDKPTGEKVAGVLGVAVLQCYSWGGGVRGNCSTVATVARGWG